MKTLSVVCSLFLLCLSCLSAYCDEVTGTISAAARARDPRLERKVSLSGERLPLGALLAGFAKQTGVATQMDERDALSGIPLVVVLKEVPLADAMNAVWSLLSFPKAPWRWEVTGAPGQYIYAFTPSFAARQLPMRLQADVQGKFEAHAATMLRLAQMGTEERKEHVKDLTASFLQTQDGTAKAWVNDDLKWEGLRTFAEALSQEDQAQVLRSQKNMEIPVSRLSTDGRAFITNYMNRMKPTTTNAAGISTPLPEPDKIEFGTNYVQGQQDGAPILYIYIHGYGLSFMGGGALSRGFKASIGKQWLLPGDAAEDALERRVLTNQPAASKAGGEFADQIRETTFKTAQALTDMAAAAPLSLLALVNENGEGQSVPLISYGKTFKEYFDEISVAGMLIKKWRGHILLLSTPNRFMYDDVNVPYRLIKSLTRYGVRGTNFLSLADMAEIQATVSPRRLLANSRRYGLLGVVAQFAPVLAYFRKDRDLTRTGGTRLGPELAGALREMLHLPPQHPLLSGQDMWVRVSFWDDNLSAAPTRYNKLEYMGSDRKWVLLYGFKQTSTSADEAVSQ